MGVALAGLALGNLPIMLVALFLRGIQSSCYSPSKFGMLPEVLPERLLSWGNGVIELGSFVAIIAGTVAGTTLYSKFSGQLGYAGLILFAVTLAGVAVSVTLPRVPAAGGRSRCGSIPFPAWSTNGSRCARDRTLFLAVLGMTYFFMLATLLQFAVNDYGLNVLNVGHGQHGLPAGRDRNRHRYWKPGRRLPLGRKDRIRTGPARRRGHDGPVAALLARPGLYDICDSGRCAGVCKRLLRGAGDGDHPASAGPCEKRAASSPRRINCRSLALAWRASCTPA